MGLIMKGAIMQLLRMSNEVIQKLFHVSSCTLRMVDNSALPLFSVHLEA
jgi:hypothetical protein